MERVVRKLAAPVQPLPKKKRVAAYARVSSGKDAMLHSLSAQVSYYSAYIQRHADWQYMGVYADEALTGTKDTRAKFQRLIQDCRDGKIDMVLTKSISRFARDTVTLLSTVRELKGLNVDVYFEEQNIHSMSSDGELMLTILASYAQEESRAASENRKWQIRNDFKHGKPNFFRIYGYRMVNGRLEIVPDEANVVRMIFQDCLSGMGREMICKKLNEQGVSPLEGKQWVPGVINYMLKNECYVGNLKLQKTFVVDHLRKKRQQNRGELPQYLVQGSHEAIVSRETFDAVQRVIADRVAHYRPSLEATERYPFSGILRCEQCGKYYRRKTAMSGTPYAKPVWICVTFNTFGKKYCRSKQIPEQILLRTTADVLMLPDFDEQAFRLKIAKILVTGPNRLRYLFRDGKYRDIEWQDHSRRNSWTAEMRAQAAKHAKKRCGK